MVLESIIIGLVLWYISERWIEVVKEHFVNQRFQMERFVSSTSGLHEKNWKFFDRYVKHFEYQETLYKNNKKEDDTKK